MTCHAMHPIQDLFLKKISYVLQFEMHFYMHSYVDKKFILVKSGCYSFDGAAKLLENKGENLTMWEKCQI
jgi:hypothetical protein